MSDSFALPSASDSASAEVSASRAARSTIGNGLQAIVDQFIFSLGNFAAAVIIGRMAGAQQLGIYSLTMSIVFIAAAVQRALVAAPYTVQVQRLDEVARRTRRGSALVQAIAIGGLLCIVLALTADLFLDGDTRARVTLAVLAGTAASWGLRDFCRRILFADHHFTEAVIFDAAVVALQIGCLLAFAWHDQLSASTALLSIVLSSGVVTLCWLMMRRTNFSIESTRLLPDVQASWQFGRWAATSEATFAGQDFAIQALLATSSSFATTGIYAACMSIVRLINPLVQAIGNFIGPHSARSLHQGGVPKLAGGVRRVTRLMVPAMLGVHRCDRDWRADWRWSPSTATSMSINRRCWLCSPLLPRQRGSVWRPPKGFRRWSCRSSICCPTPWALWSL